MYSNSGQICTIDISDSRRIPVTETPLLSVKHLDKRSIRCLIFFGVKGGLNSCERKYHG